MRVTSILTSLGWIKGNQKRVNGKRLRVWIKEENHIKLTKKEVSVNTKNFKVGDIVTPLSDENKAKYGKYGKIIDILPTNPKTFRVMFDSNLRCELLKQDELDFCKQRQGVINL